MSLHEDSAAWYDHGLLAVFAGGGTAGHIIPGLAVIDELRRHGWRAAWIGSRRPAERELVGAAGVPFHAIPAGKLRRYLSLRNLFDLVLVAAGCVRSLALLAALRPAVLFAKGSYVSVPPVIAARLLGIPVITHESDATPALATRINATMAGTVLVAFDATRALLPPRLHARVRVTGNPLRTGLELGEAQRARARLAVPDGVPLLLVTGGSSGARAVNELIWAALPAIARHWFVVHQTGAEWRPPGGGALTPETAGRYRALPFVSDGFADLLAAAAVVVSRAGANTLGELAATGTPAVLIPLPRTQSRGEQLANARLFAARGAAVTMEEEGASADGLTRVLEELRTDAARRADMARAMAELADREAAVRIAAIVARTGAPDDTAGGAARATGGTGGPAPGDGTGER